MWLALYPAFLAALWVWSLYSSALHLVVLASLLYLLHYLCYVYRVSTPRPWPWLRSLSLWDHFHRRHLGIRVPWSEGSNWVDYADDKPRLFVLADQTPHAAMALLLTFGLHGTHPKAIARLAPLIVLPAHLFQLPLIANFCQWLGGIPYDRAVLEELLKSTTGTMVLALPLDVEDDPFVCVSQLEASVVLTPVVCTGSNDFYLALGPCHFGLFFGCLPRKCHIRIALGTPIPSTALLTGDADTLEAKVRHGHETLKKVLTQ